MVGHMPSTLRLGRQQTLRALSIAAQNGPTRQGLLTEVRSDPDPSDLSASKQKQLLSRCHQMRALGPDL